MHWPTVVYSEEVMREGFGIERAGISLQARLALLDALSDTGLKRITVGAFVSPRYVPQMADFEELLRAMQPRAGVSYLTFVHNHKARLRAQAFSPPLTIAQEVCALSVDLCDIHQRRNMNRSIEQGIEGWSVLVDDARSRGVTTASVAIFSAWGSNFMGKFSQPYRLAMLGRQIDQLTAAGMDVAEVGLHDSQSWCLPHEMEHDLREIKRRWPQVKHFHLHMHDARGMALACIYSALRTLDSGDTLLLEGTLGGIGGGQYCGNGQASGMAATEDLLHMLEGMGIPTGVDLDKLIACVWMLEEIIGRPAFGHVSKAGPRPTRPGALYDANLPAVESLQAARHFRLGASVCETEGYRPWSRPITGPYFNESTSHTKA